MSKPKRSAILREAMASNFPNTESRTPKAPALPNGELDKAVDAGIQARLSFSKVRDYLDIAGVSLEEFLKKEFHGLSVMKSQRVIKTPSGNEYTAVFTHLSYEELKNKTVIDSDNVRDESERTEEALADLIDEIGNGFQLQAAIAYIDEDGNISFVEGSRRRAAALFGESGLDVEIFDCKPDSSDLLWMVEASDRRREFSYYDRGRLYSKLLVAHACTQADLCKKNGYTTTDVSRSIQFFKYVTAAMQVYLSVKDCSAREVDELNKLLKEVHEKAVLEEFIAHLAIHNPDHNKAFIKLATQFVDKLNARKVKPKPVPVVLFESEKSKVEFVKPSASKFKIEFKKISKEDEEHISKMIQAYFESK